MSDETITPALTDEEWRAALDNEFVRQRMLAESCDPVLGNDHRRAALSLYGQSFGFTQADVVALRGLVAAARSGYLDRHEDWSLDSAEAIARRLAALLPPP